MSIEVIEGFTGYNSNFASPNPSWNGNNPFAFMYQMDSLSAGVYVLDPYLEGDRSPYKDVPESSNKYSGFWMHAKHFRDYVYPESPARKFDWIFSLIGDDGRIDIYCEGAYYAIRSVSEVFGNHYAISDFEEIENLWRFLEVGVTGTLVEFRVNGYVGCSFNIDSPTVFNRIQLGSITGGYYQQYYNLWYSSLYVCNSDGPTNNGFLGPIYVKRMIPNADVTKTNVVSGSYLDIDDITADGSSTKVEILPPGQSTGKFTFTATVQQDDPILAVSIKSGAYANTQAIASVPWEFATTIKFNGIEQDSGSYSRPYYDIYSHTHFTQSIVMDNLPDGSPLTKNNLELAEFGIKVRDLRVY